MNAIKSFKEKLTADFHFKSDSINSWIIISPRHPYTRKFFRSMKSFREERQREPSAVHPFSDLCLLFVLLTTPLNVICSVLISYMFSFYPQLDGKLNMTAILVVTGMLWLLESAFNFSTGLVTGKKVDLCRANIVRDYFKSYFMYDLLSTLGLMFFRPLNPLPWLRALTFPRFAKKLKVFTQILGMNYVCVRVLRLVLFAIYFTHLTTCLYCYPGVLVSFRSYFYHPVGRSDHISKLTSKLVPKCQLTKFQKLAF